MKLEISVHQSKKFVLEYLKNWFIGLIIIFLFVVVAVSILSFVLWEIPQFHPEPDSFSGARLALVMYSAIIYFLTYVKLKK